MPTQLLPTTGEIKSIVENHLALTGNRVSDCYEDGTRLYLRAVLPHAEDIRPQDTVHAGVAVMVVGEEIRVHPCAYRVVCRNGSIAPRVEGTRTIQRWACDADTVYLEEVEADLARALDVCMAPETAFKSFQEMRAATQVDANFVIQLLPHMTRLGMKHARHLLAAIERRFELQNDRSAYGLMNAVTAVARDQRDPQTRWRLEELGGAIPARVPHDPRPLEAAAQPPAMQAVGVF